MPVLPSSIYPVIEDVMNLVRVFVNDTFKGETSTEGEGRTFTDDWAGTVPLFNKAQRQLERKLANNGVTTYRIDNWLLPNVLGMSNPDPGLQCNISYTGYFDGTGSSQNPALPANLYLPVRLWQRTSGSTDRFAPIPQRSILDYVVQNQYIQGWNWAQDQINFIGATNSIDLLMSGQARIFVPITTDTDFETTTLSTADCYEALAYQMAYDFCSARGGGASKQLMDDKNEAIQQMVTRYVRAQQSISYHREPYGDQQEYSGIMF
jgi:hypothetical protein